MSLPTGTVTFLFTDIEGSTRLWEQYPEAMRPALARHDFLMRQAIESQGGYVFKTVGDAFYAAFHAAPQALAAALVAQQALNTESWPEPISLRVRMAVHTGAVESRDNDYFGPPLNRVARLLSAGHGGQVLLSQSARDLIGDSLPVDASLQGLGEHRLRDLARPETIYQLLHPDLRSEFPPLRSLSNSTLPNNLPLQLTSFIGREQEMVEVKALLGRARLVTLTGAGGCGKTRLALQVAADMFEANGDGVWLVELASLADPTLVVQTVANTLSVMEQTGQNIAQTLVDYLKPKKLLLLLDNCEHLVDACARLAETLLKNCPQIRLLVTSREVLGIAGEQIYSVPPLSLPPSWPRRTIKSLMRYESVRLFVERAQAVQPAFTVTDQNAPALAQLSVQLDGIPFAIELAAARVRALTVEQIAERLADRFRLLTGGSRTALPRQQTLRALIDWSYDLLNDQERRLLHRLSVFEGGWTLDAAEQVCTDAIEDWEVLDLLTSLVDKSLAIVEDRKGAIRYRFLETIREYAAEKLEASGEAEVMRERHQAFYRALAEAARPHLQGPEQAQWLQRLEDEHGNLRAALQGSVGEANLRMAGALWRYWESRGYYNEGRAVCAAVLAQPEAQAPTMPRAALLNGAGNLAYHQGDSEAARQLWEESLAICRTLENKQGISIALGNLGNIASDRGDFARARELYGEALALKRAMGGEPVSEAITLSNLGNVHLREQDYAGARSLYRDALRLHESVGNIGGRLVVLTSLGATAFMEGELQEAQAAYYDVLSLCREVGDPLWTAMALEGMARVVSRQDHGEAAVQLYSASAALRDSIHLPMEADDEEARAEDLEALREQIGPAAFHRAEQAGHEMNLPQAITYALEMGRNAEGRNLPAA